MTHEKHTQSVVIPDAGWLRSHQVEAQLHEQGVDAVAYTVPHDNGGLLVMMNLEGELSVYFIDENNEGNRLAPPLARKAWAAAIACDQSFARA